jgi:hypothetical protein
MCFIIVSKMRSEFSTSICNQALLDKRVEATVAQNPIFWYIMSCNPLKINRCFGRTYRLHFQSQAKQ